LKTTEGWEHDPRFAAYDSFFGVPHTMCRFVFARPEANGEVEKVNFQSELDKREILGKKEAA